MSYLPMEIALGFIALIAIVRIHLERRQDARKQTRIYRGNLL